MLQKQLVYCQFHNLSNLIDLEFYADQSSFLNRNSNNPKPYLSTLILHQKILHNWIVFILILLDQFVCTCVFQSISVFFHLRMVSECEPIFALSLDRIMSNRVINLPYATINEIGFTLNSMSNKFKYVSYYIIAV